MVGEDDTGERVKKRLVPAAFAAYQGGVVPFNVIMQMMNCKPEDQTKMLEGLTKGRVEEERKKHEQQIADMTEQMAQLQDSKEKAENDKKEAENRLKQLKKDQEAADKKAARALTDKTKEEEAKIRFRVKDELRKEFNEQFESERAINENLRGQIRNWNNKFSELEEERDKLKRELAEQKEGEEEKRREQENDRQERMEEDEEHIVGGWANTLRGIHGAIKEARKGLPGCLESKHWVKFGKQIYRVIDDIIKELEGIKEELSSLASSGNSGG